MWKTNDRRTKKSWRFWQLGFGSWTIIVVLLTLLAATALVAYAGWRLGDDADVPIAGYVAMALGVSLSLVAGFGLMALVFFSSRKGYDEPPVLLAPAEKSGEDSIDVSDPAHR